MGEPQQEAVENQDGQPQEDQTTEQGQEFFEEVSVDDILKEADEAEVENESESDQSKSEKSEEETKEGEATESDEEETTEKDETSEELTEEEFNKLAEKHPEIAEYKKYYDDYGNWEASQRKKSQFISWAKKLHDNDPDGWERLQNVVMPYVYGKKEIPKAPDELVDEVVNNVELDDLSFVDDDDFEVSVPKEQLKPAVRKAVQQVLNDTHKELPALRSKVSELEKENKKLKENGEASQKRLGEVEMERMESEHEDLKIKRVNEEEGILDAIARIDEDEQHPEYRKLERWRSIGNLADRKQWSLQKAYNYLFGAEERQSKDRQREEQAALKKQKTSTQESPSTESGEEMSEEERFLEDIGGHEAKVQDIFKDV
ncbi:MAG: hypothetical protein GF313_09390 [Caldithrix sp.]|nr:hypothetical protein [Caldithrix sp.]